MTWSSAMDTNNQYIKYKIGITQNSQDVTNNKSNVTVQVKFYRTNTDYETYGSGTVYCKINGTEYTASVTSSQKITSSGIVLFSKTMDIAHNADGTKTLATSAKITHSRVNSSYQSYSQALTTIPRASSISLSASTIEMGKSVTISIARASSGFTHDLTYSFGSASGTIGTGIATSKTWTVPSSLASQIPNATSGTGIITCVTKDSSGNSIGTKSVSFTATVPSSVVPSITSITLSDPNNYASTYGGYVQNKSTVKVQVASAGVSGSTITKTSITALGQTVTTNPWASNVITDSAGSKTVSVTVTDSRGRTATSNATFTVLEYSSPIASKLKVSRCNSDGTANDEGAYAKISYAGSISPLNNNNGKSIIVKYKAQDSDTWTTAVNVSEYSRDTTVIVPADVDKSYDVKLTVTDSFGSATRSAQLSTAFTLIDFNASGKGVAFGKVSTSDSFEVNMDTSFKNLRTIAGGDLDVLYTILGINGMKKVGATDLNTFTETGFYYVNNGSTELNFPNGTNAVLLCFKADKVTRQLYFRIGTIDTNDMNIYTRQIQPSTDTYGAWKKFTLT